MNKNFSLHTSLYSKDVILKSAYKLSNYFSIDLDIKGQSFQVLLSANKAATSDSFSFAVDEFKKNIVDEQLREKLKAETENERNLILGIAFSKGNFNSE